MTRAYSLEEAGLLQESGELQGTIGGAKDPVNRGPRASPATGFPAFPAVPSFAAEEEVYRGLGSPTQTIFCCSGVVEALMIGFEIPVAGPSRQKVSVDLPCEALFQLSTFSGVDGQP